MSRERPILEDDNDHVFHTHKSSYRMTSTEEISLAQFLSCVLGLLLSLVCLSEYVSREQMARWRVARDEIQSNYFI